MATDSGSSLGASVGITQERVECRLAWSPKQPGASGAGSSLELTATLAGSEGDRLGAVHWRLRQNAANVAAQWEDCGVIHGGRSASSGSPCYDEVILDFGRLTT